MAEHKIENLIIHCSDSNFGNANLIRGWHTTPKPNGNGWKDIGYHLVILNGRIGGGLFLPSLDGSVEFGRQFDGDQIVEMDEIGAHAYGLNNKSFGICLIGVKTFTDSQISTLISVLQDLLIQFELTPDDVVGHYETKNANGKTCPNLDMDSIRRRLKHV